MDIGRPKMRCMRILRLLRKRLLAILTILGILLGFAIGFGVRNLKLSDNAIMWIGFPGEMFLSLLKMPIIPVIVSSVISATGAMDLKKNGKLGLLLFALHISSNAMGSGFGIIAGVTIKPGVGLGNNTLASTKKTTAKMETQDIAADLLRNLVPDNLVRATFQKKITQYDVEEITQKGPNGTENTYREVKRVAFVDSMNVIGLMFGCTVLGLAAGAAGEKGKAMLNFFDSSTATILLVLRWFLWAAPVGVLSLVAASVAAIESLSDMFVKLGLFVGAVILALFVEQIVVLPLIYVAITRKNPFKVHFANLKAFCVGFAAVSSAAAIPYMFDACKKLKIDDRVTSFGVPLSATVNSTGSAVFICCSVVFLAQLSHITLNATHLLTLFIISGTSSFALPGAPSASIVLVVIFCTTLGVPVDDIALLFAVEWLLDRCRTACNVGTETFIMAATWHCIKKDFKGNDMVEDAKQLPEDVEISPLNGNREIMSFDQSAL